MSLLDFGDDPSPASASQIEVTASDTVLDPFDPFSGPSEPKAAGAESDTFGEFDPFGGSPLSPQSAPSMDMVDSSLSERDQRAFEAQFDDLLGDLGGSSGPQGNGDASTEKVDNGLLDSMDDLITETDGTMKDTHTETHGTADDGDIGSHVAIEDNDTATFVNPKDTETETQDFVKDGGMGDIMENNDLDMHSTEQEEASEDNTKVSNNQVAEPREQPPPMANPLLDLFEPFSGQKSSASISQNRASPGTQSKNTKDTEPTNTQEAIGADNSQDTGNMDKDKKMVDYMKERYANKPQELPQKISREPKKLEHQWSRQSEEGSVDSPTRKTPGMEQEMLQYTGFAGVGIDYSKAKYESQVSRAESGLLSPTSPHGHNANRIPVNWQTVEKLPAPEITKSVRAKFESGEVAHREVKKSFNREFKPPAESGTFENEPDQLDDSVVRGGEMEDEKQKPSQGATRQRLSAWKAKGSEGYSASRNPINVAEDAGCVLESEPKVRDDVTRETDTIGTNGLPEMGKANKMLDHWTTIKDRQPKPKRTAIKLVEREEDPAVYENQPDQVAEGVVRGEDYIDDVKHQPGMASNLKGYWAGVSDDKEVQRQTVNIDYESGPVIRESEPTVRDDVVRESDIQHVDRNLTLQAGHARNVATRFIDKEEQLGERKDPIALDTSSGPTVTENQPTVLENVVRSGDYTEDVRTQSGHTRNIANVFANPEDKWANRKREKIVIDTSNGPTVVENEPMQLDDSVVRGGDAGLSVDIGPGRTRSMVHTWVDKEAEEATIKTSSWSPRDIEVAKDAGVYENEPTVREDVVKHDEMEPDLVPAHKANNMRQMWSTREQEEEMRLRKERTPECVRFTPPREMTPPDLHRPSLHSFQQLTLSDGIVMNGEVENGHPGEEDMVQDTGMMDYNSQAADTQMDYIMQPPPSETVKTSTTLTLMQS